MTAVLLPRVYFIKPSLQKNSIKIIYFIYYNSVTQIIKLFLLSPNVVFKNSELLTHILAINLEKMLQQK